MSIMILFLLSSAAVLALQPELRLAVPLLVGVTSCMTITLAVVFYCGERGKISWSPSTVLFVAIMLRLLFLCAPPQLSDDIYRYVWDGSTLVRGTNPYAAAPAAVKPPPELAAVHSRINHPQYTTIYPPAAQIFFALGTAPGRTITGLKAFLVCLDIGLCALLIILLKQLEMPVWRSVLYAWNPLPILEIAGSGHVDGAGLAMLIASICLIVNQRRNPCKTGSHIGTMLCAGALFACAGLVKLFPFALTPLLLLLVPAGRRRFFAAGFIAALAALIMPFLPHLANMFNSLNTYARNWEFAGFAFTTLRAMTGSGTAARVILSAAFLMVVAAIMLRFVCAHRCADAPVAETRLTLNSCYAIAMALLLLTPTLQPWYALCLAVFLPFCAGPTGLVLCWAVFLTYQVQISYFITGQWLENPLVTAAVFLGPVTAWLLARLFAGGDAAPMLSGTE